MNRFLAAVGLGSRRACEELIREGRVHIDGEVVEQLGSRVEPERQEVRVDGERVRLPRRWKYYVLHKPSGFVTTLSDERGRRTVVDLIGRLRGSVAPVGRLDRASEGLLLLTDNGKLAQRLLHPRYRQPRTYLVWVDPPPTAEQVTQIEGGLPIGGGERSGPAEVRVLARRRGVGRVRITLREGKNREVRRIFRTLGIRVTALRRVAYAGIELGPLPPGAVRPLNPKEIEELARRTGLEL